MTISCLLPPVDQRYARVVAKNGEGVDVVAFSGGRPAGAPVVSSAAGTATPRADLVLYGYRNPVVVQVDASDGASLATRRWICLSGLAFAGRASGPVSPGTPVGDIAVPDRIDFLRSRDRTAGVDPRNAYLHVEVWSQEMPTFVPTVSSMGPSFRVMSGIVAPDDFWPAFGIDFIGAPGSQVMAVRLGGPSDCRRAA